MSLALPFAARSASAEGALIVASVAAALFALAAFSPAVLGDGDTFSHLATDESILAHGAAPRADPFSSSFPGAPWTAHEWLSEILMTLAFRCAGWSGVALITAAAAASAGILRPSRRRFRAIGSLGRSSPPDAGIVATLDREPGWRRLYADGVAVVHVRDGAAPAAAGFWGD